MKNREEIDIAISLYSGYSFGKKCVGITTTTNEILRNLGKEAVENIIKEDATHPLEFFWCECSDAVEHLFEKHGGIKIHKEFVKYYINKDVNLNSWLNDDYHYTRILANGKEVTKTIVGFNSQETFDIVYKHYKDEIDQKLESIRQELENDKQNIKENVDSYDYDLEFAEYLVGEFWLYVNELGVNEFPVFFLNAVNDAIITIKMRGVDVKMISEEIRNVTPLKCDYYYGTEAIDTTSGDNLVAESKK